MLSRSGWAAGGQGLTRARAMACETGARVRVAGACGARACDVQDDAPAPAVMNMKETHVAHPRTPMRMSILK